MKKFKDYKKLTENHSLIKAGDFVRIRMWEELILILKIRPSGGIRFYTLKSDSCPKCEGKVEWIFPYT